MTKLTIIAAVDVRTGGIGFKGKLPWNIPEDMKHFRKVTKQKPNTMKKAEFYRAGNIVIMGRKTFDSIGKPLPYRRNIVITRQKDWKPGNHNVEVVHSFEEALTLIGETKRSVFVIGGGEIYKEALPLADTVVLTQVSGTFECDTFFPLINRKEWRMVNVTPGQNSTEELKYVFVTFIRTDPPEVALKRITDMVMGRIEDGTIADVPVSKLSIPMLNPEKPGNWPEDFSHENGNYECLCSGCNQTFYGHKRRVCCKVCASQ